MSTNEIVICGTGEDVPDGRSNTFVIERQIREFDEETANDVHDRLVGLDLDHQYDVPVYEIFGHHVWRDGGGLHEHSPFSMELIVLLYRRIVEEVADVDQIVAIGVGGRYLDMLRDLADNEGVELVVRDRPEECDSDRSVRWDAFQWVPIVLFDVFCSLFLKLLFRAGKASTLVVYPAFRPETFRPLERHLDVEYDGSVYVLTLSYLLNYPSLFEENISVAPIHCFESVQGFLSQCRFAIVFALDLQRRETECRMVDAVEDETGIRLDRTVGSLYHRAAAFNFASCLRYETANRAFERSRYEVLMLPSSDGINKAIGLAAREADVDVLLLPHTILHQHTPTEVPFCHTRIVEGTIAREELRKVDEIESLELGLPKHITIREQARSMECESERERILIGTQPYEDGRRREFITDVISAGLETTDHKIVVKIHPAEDREFYESIVENLDLADKGRQRILITDGDLYRNVIDSDLMVTISSNVGIEAIILGTPTICYNKWSPDIRTPLYSTDGNVPYIDNYKDLLEAFGEVPFTDHRRSQDRMLDEEYKVRGNSLQTISEGIEAQIRKSTAQETDK